MTPQPSLTVDVYFDLICPWCLIGKRHLDAALTRWAQEQPDVPVRLAWHA
ncbi:DsbA family protein, partial [Cupriavidus basilensis]